jgi:hypothetical protein
VHQREADARQREATREAGQERVEALEAGARGLSRDRGLAGPGTGRCEEEERNEEQRRRARDEPRGRARMPRTVVARDAGQAVTRDGREPDTLVTLPERRQRVQTRIRRTVPAMMARALCRFGCQTRLVLLLAWLTLWPTERVFPQI